MATDRMILGENAIYSTDCNVTGVNNNVLVCGSSGCGKTMSISEPRLLETFNSSLIATVTKRRLVNKYKAVFRQRGYVVEDLNFINPTESSIAYDPLKYVKSYTDITFLAESIVKANPRKDKSTADPYWDESAVSLLSAEIEYVRLNKGKKASFADVLDLHSRLKIEDDDDKITTSLDEEFEYMEENHPDSSFAISCWNSFHELPPKTARCIFGALNVTIDTIFTPELRKMISNDKKLDFERLAKQRSVLFVSTSAVNPALHCFVNIFYGQVFKTLFEYAERLPDGKLPIPVHVLCDDFATGSRILNFSEYISIFREKQISVTLLVQSESQLESMYGSEDATTIINNCDTYLYMGGMDLLTARSISQRLNAPLEDILYMPVGQICIFRRGQKPIITQRYDILKNEMYQRITRRFEGTVHKYRDKQRDKKQFKAS